MKKNLDMDKLFRFLGRKKKKRDNFFEQKIKMANVELISSEQILAAKNGLDDIGARSCELRLFF